MSTQRTSLLLGPDDAGRFVSAEEFAEADFIEPWTYEREAGRLVVVSPDSKEHDDCSEPIRDHLGAFRLAHPGVIELVVSEAWIRVGGGTDRIADIAVYLVRPKGGPERPDRIPELVFEVVSPDRESRDRDYVRKRREYRALGVREYVIVDRFLGRFVVLTLGPRGYRRRTLRRGQIYQSPLLPGLAIPLDEVV